VAQYNIVISGKRNQVLISVIIRNLRHICLKLREFSHICCQLYTCVSKTSHFGKLCFDKHGLILIIFGKQYQHTFRNYMNILLSFTRYPFPLYLLQLLLNSCEGNDTTPATWSSASLTHVEAYHKMSLTKLRSMQKAVMCMREGERTSLY